MKSRSTVATACHLFALRSSTLLKNTRPPLAKCRLSHSPPDRSVIPIAALHTSCQEAADKLAWSLLPARASNLHARSLLASKQDSPIYIHVFVRSYEWEGGGAFVHAGRWHAGRSLTHSTLSGVRADNGLPCGLMSFTVPS